MRTGQSLVANLPISWACCYAAFGPRCGCRPSRSIKSQSARQRLKASRHRRSRSVILARRACSASMLCRPPPITRFRPQGNHRSGCKRAYARAARRDCCDRTPPQRATDLTEAQALGSRISAVIDTGRADHDRECGTSCSPAIGAAKPKDNAKHHDQCHRGDPVRRSRPDS
jgi:hypothetical protein